MLSIIACKSISSRGDLVFGLHRLGHQALTERQDYKVKVFEGMEFDECDTLACLYHVYPIGEDSKIHAARVDGMLERRFSGSAATGIASPLTILKPTEIRDHAA